MTDSEDWSVLLKRLDDLKESISQKFGNEKNKTLRDKTTSVDAPSVDFYYLERKIEELKSLLNGRMELSLQANKKTFVTYSNRIDSWIRNDRTYLVNSSYSNKVILSLILMLDDIRQYTLQNTKPISPEADQRRLNNLRLEIQSLERNKREQEQKLGEVANYIKAIKEAREAALELPETLNSLKDANNTVAELKQAAESSKIVIDNVEKFAKETELFLAPKREQIANLIKRAEEALRASTGAGLAQAFSNNATKLKKSSHCWCSALVVALSLAVVIGYCRMSAIFDLIKNPNIDTALVWANILMSFALIAAPTWFAWIAAKRIAHLFRLIEDYDRVYVL